MYVRGKLQRIYPNGRIVYEGQGDVLQDGSGEAAQGVACGMLKRLADDVYYLWSHISVQ
jgi:hypothetical protein